MNNNELKQAVVQCFKGRVGRSRATKGRDIAHYLGQKDDRRVRIIIRELIAEGYPIASSVQSPFGYYLIQDRSEATIYLQTLKNRLIEDALRRRDFKRGASCNLAGARQGVLL